MSSTIAANDPRLSFEFHAPGEDVLNSPGLVVPQLYDWNAKTNPNYPLFLFHDDEKRQYITYSSANEAISRAARYTLSSVGPHDDAPQKPRRVIAMLANTGNVTFATTHYYDVFLTRSQFQIPSPTSAPSSALCGPGLQCFLSPPATPPLLWWICSSAQAQLISLSRGTRPCKS